MISLTCTLRVPRERGVVSRRLSPLAARVQRVSARET